jgi:thiol-disulfide isomerase/thioredoxin
MRRHLLLPALLATLALLPDPAFAGGHGHGHRAPRPKPHQHAQHHKKPKPQPPPPKVKPAPPETKSEVKPKAKPAEGPPRPIAIGSLVEGSLQVTGLDGRTHGLAEYRNRPLVLVFWSAECSFCSAYAHKLDVLDAVYGKRGVELMAVDPNPAEFAGGKDRFVKIQSEALKQNLTLPVVVDESQRLANRLGVRATPQVLILDERGVLRYSGALDDDPIGEKRERATPFVANALDALLDGREVPIALTGVTGTGLVRAKEPAVDPKAKKAAKRPADSAPDELKQPAKGRAPGDRAPGQPAKPRSRGDRQPRN